MSTINQLLKKAILPLVVSSSVIISGNSCQAQEINETEEAFHPHHQIGLAVSHANVFEGRDNNGDKKVISLPCWGIDYNYIFHPRWGIGLHTDIIIEKFQVESDGEGIERSYPVAPALMGIYKAGEHWNFLLGIGGEFAKEENFGLTRVGVEYSGELPKRWEVFGTFSYDMKWNAYDTWVIGIGLAKIIGKR